MDSVPGRGLPQVPIFHAVGVLTVWGPVHSEAFWAEHAKSAEKDDFALVRRLVEVLSEPTGDVEALAVASYDLGEIAHRHAGAKSALVKLGAKDAALKLIDHEDEEVQRRALQCVSKILLRGGSVKT